MAAGAQRRPTPVPALPAARPRLQGGGDRRRLCDRARARRILPAERALGRARRDAARDAAVQPRLHRHLPVRARDRRRATIRASSRPCSGRAGSLFEAVYVLFVILILAVYGAAAGAIGAALFGLPTHRRDARADGRDHRSSSRFGNTLGRAPVRLCLLPALRRLRPVRDARLRRSSATGSRPASRADVPAPGWALGGADLCQLQSDRRGRHPAGRAPPDQQPRRHDRRR